MRFIFKVGKDAPLFLAIHHRCTSIYDRKGARKCHSELSLNVKCQFNGGHLWHKFNKGHLWYRSKHKIH